MDTESAGFAQQGTYVDLAADKRLGLGPLEPAERQLLASLRTGEPAVVFGMGSDGADDRGRVRASLIRQVMLGRAVPYAEIDPHGLQLTGAHIVDRLDLDDVSSPLSLSFHDCTLSEGLSLARASTGSIWCTGKTRITAKPQTVPFNATSATIAHHLVVQCEIRATGTPQGAVSLQGTRIGGLLDCGNGTFINPAGPALHADDLHTDDQAVLAARFEGSGELGAVRLRGAHIGGQLDCRDGTFTNPDGPALHAEGLRTDSLAVLASRFEGGGEAGAVRLHGAHIGGSLDCRNGTFTNPDGPALHADGLRTDGHAYLGGRFEGGGEMGAVRLHGAHIGGYLNCTRRGGLRSTTAGALRLQGATVQKELFLSPDFVTDDTPARWLALDGLTYTGLPLIVSADGMRQDPDLRMWRDLLSKHTMFYAAQPWQHLAAAHRAAGHEKSAKRLLIDQQDDRRDRVIRGDDDSPHPWTWVRRNVLMRGSKALTGYGYKTSWTLLWLLGWAGVGVGVSLSTQHVDTQTTYVKTGESKASTDQLPAAVHGRLTADAGEPCSTGELVGLGLEWALPIVKTGASTVCVVNTTDPAGQWMNAASWGVQAGGWALATLVVAGYTGIVRRL